MAITVTGIQVIEDIDVNKVTTLLAGREFNAKITKLAGEDGNNILAFKKAKKEPSSENKEEDNIISTTGSTGSKSEVYAWFDENDGTIYYWSEDNHIYLNADSSGMYRNLTNIQSIDTVNFDTSEVTKMNSMFYDCRALTKLDLSKFNTSKVEDMSYLFYKCLSLTELDVSNFDTSNVTTMSYMFAGSVPTKANDTRMKLKSIKGLTSFNTSKVKNMASMFYVCTDLTSLDLTSFDTSNVTNMRGMFSGSYNDAKYYMNLTEIKGLEKFNTENVSNMDTMFQMCNKLTALDLSKFDTSRVTNMDRMFADCTSLEVIYASDKFSTSRVTSSTSMFSECNSLQGGAGTRFSKEYIDKEYARIDGVDSKSGYFTLK